MPGDFLFGCATGAFTGIFIALLAFLWIAPLRGFLTRVSLDDDKNAP